MTRTLRLWLFWSLVVAPCLISSPLRAAQKVAKPEARIVLIGINDYQDPQINDRKHAEADVQALYDLFTNKEYLGVTKENIRLLKGKKATLKNVLEAMNWLVATADDDDLALFFFVGQGGVLDKSEDRCYFTVDSKLKERGKTALAADDVRKIFDVLHARRFCAFVDVNFKGFDGKGLNIPEPRLGRSPYREFLGDDGSLAHASREGRSLFLANNGLRDSLDLKKHGLFTEALLQGLKGKADKDGYEADGSVTIKELSNWVEVQGHVLGLMHGKTIEEKRQRIVTLGESEDNAVLTFNPPAAKKLNEVIAKLRKLHEDGKIDKQLYAEALELLLHMPGSKGRQELRKKYREFVEGKVTLADLKKERNKILASLKIEEKDAKEFAEGVLEGTKIIAKEYVKKITEGELINWAIRGLYRNAGEPLPGDIAETLKNVKKLKEAELRQLLVNARTKLGKREAYKEHKDVHVALAQMMRKLDAYSTYIDPETKEEFQKGIGGQFTGIGVQVRSDPKSNYLLVVTPIKGGPAIKAGLEAGDLITEIIRDVDRNGKKLDKTEVTTTKNMRVSDAVKKITGKEGTPVKLKIERKGKKEPFVVEVKRGKVQVETVMGAKRLPSVDWDFIIDKKQKIGYIRLTQFNRTTNGEMLKAMLQLKKEGVKALVLDMRFNPGGLLYSAREVSDMFVDDGLIVEIRPREGTEKPRRLYGFTDGSYLDFPMVCLVNGGSASGAEIVAACLQDHGRSVVMGSRSFGKGTVQNIMSLGGNAQMKVTTASFWRPSGVNLNKSSTDGRDEDDWGVKPNKGFALKLSPSEESQLFNHQQETEIIYPKGEGQKTINKGFKDRQLNMALDYLRKQMQLAKLAEKDKKEKKEAEGSE